MQQPDCSSTGGDRQQAVDAHSPREVSRTSIFVGAPSPSFPPEPFPWPSRPPSSSDALDHVNRTPPRRSSSFPGPTSLHRSTAIELLESAAGQAFTTLMQPSYRIAAAGLVCLVAPLAVLLAAPLMLLLLPLLFPLGLVLTAVGIARAGIVASFAGSAACSLGRRAGWPGSRAHASLPSTPVMSRRPQGAPDSASDLHCGLSLCAAVSGSFNSSASRRASSHGSLQEPRSSFRWV